MSSKILLANGVYDLSNINNLKELQAEIEFLKISIKADERALEKDLKKLPQQLLKSTADSILPSFLNKLIANGTWKLVLRSAAMFANPFSGKFSFTKNIVGSAKKLGFMALLKGAYGAWSRKNSGKTKPMIDLKKPDITSLKTKNFKRN